MPNNINQLFELALAQNKLVLSTDQQVKLISYLDLLQRWNTVFNLTAITDAAEMIYLHLIDCLLVNPFLSGNRLLDVGSGAGLPGMVLAIIHPDQQWVLLDKSNKKTRFLTQTVAELQLKNVIVVTNHCKQFQTKLGFDTILARALTTIHQFVAEGEHLLAKDGCFLAMKGKYPKEELLDLPTGFVVQGCHRIAMIGRNVERHVVCIARND
jgi:16S rRNA (guanine527-N7)-methyltransferase